MVEGYAQAVPNAPCAPLGIGHLSLNPCRRWRLGGPICNRQHVNEDLVWRPGKSFYLRNTPHSAWQSRS